MCVTMKGRGLLLIGSILAQAFSYTSDEVIKSANDASSRNKLHDSLTRRDPRNKTAGSSPTSREDTLSASSLSRLCLARCEAVLADYKVTLYIKLGFAIPLRGPREGRRYTVNGSKQH